MTDAGTWVAAALGGNLADVRGTVGSPTTPTTSAPTIFTANHLPIRLIQTMLHHDESKDTAPRALRRAVQLCALRDYCNASHYQRSTPTDGRQAFKFVERKREKEGERERERERKREREREPSTGQTSQWSKGPRFSGKCTFQPWGRCS